MLKSLVFLALAALVAASTQVISTDLDAADDVTTQEESCTTASDSPIATYMTNNGFDDSTLIDIIERLAVVYNRLTIVTLLYASRLYSSGDYVTSFITVLKMFGLAAYGEDESLQTELLTTLNITYDEITKAAEVVEQIVNTEGNGYTSKVAMQLYELSSKQFSDALISTASSTFNIGLSSLDGCDASTAVSTIESWLTEQSCAATDVITDCEITSGSGIVAIGYNKFDTTVSSTITLGDSVDIDFTASDGTTSTVSATQFVGQILYKRMDSLGATVVGIPLSDDDASYLKLVYPDSPAGFEDVLVGLQDDNIRNEMLTTGDVVDGAVVLPFVTSLTHVENKLTWLKLYRRARAMLWREDYNVCDGVYQDSSFCGYLSAWKTVTEINIDTTQLETTCDASSSATTYTIDVPFIGLVCNPLSNVIQNARMYKGPSS